MIQLRRASSIAAVLALALVLAGCAGWKAKSTATFEEVGNNLKVAYTTIDTNCTSGRIDAGMCQKLKADYNKAHDAWAAAGTMLIQAARTEKLINETADTVKKGELQSQYQVMLSQYSTFIGQVMALIQTISDTVKSMGG